MMNKRGYTLIEVMLSIAIISLVFPILIGSVSNLLKSQTASKHYNQAVLIAQDALEIAYNLLQTDFGNFPESCNDCYLRRAGNSWEWETGTGPNISTRFTRKIEIAQLYRNLDDELTDTPGTLEPSARRIKVTVSWDERGQSQEISLGADFVNWEAVNATP